MLKAAVTAALALLAGPRTAFGQAITQQEALGLAFPAPVQVERRTAFLDDAQMARTRLLAGANVAITQRVVTYYAGVRDGAVVGVAYFDVHRVRTMSEIVMVVVGPAHAVQRVEILKFMEPPEYKASAAWLEQFNRKQLSPDLSLKRGIANMTGASLTSNAVTNAVRRALAIDAVIAPMGAEK